MEIQTFLPQYIEPLAQGILNLLPCYIEPLVHGILNFLWLSQAVLFAYDNKIDIP
jgi:hypothetical protein